MTAMRDDTIHHRANRIGTRTLPLPRLGLRRLFAGCLAVFLIPWAILPSLQAAPRTYRIMPVGDSITEGGGSFSNWRYPLWEKLYTAGYVVEYVGSRKSPSRIGDLCHEGYGGKNSGFLAATVPANFKRHPADVVLLHAGHNQFADQQPVPRIVRDTEDLIAGFRAVNPKVIVLLAQPIPSGKLPKYSYIPELHGELAKLASRLDRAAAPVRIVPQGDGFDPVRDTVADLVHPNESGAAKMADRWFEALVRVLEKPASSYEPRIVPYKKTGKGDLALHVFRPAGEGSGPRPAIVFFFGGGWKHGTPLQFYPECAWFAAKGVVAISADYRTSFTHGTTPFEAVADGKSAIRWIRLHAGELGVDPKRIVAAGASAGGQVAAATGTLSALDDPSDDLTVSSRPDALALWYPVLDNGPDGYGDATIKARYRGFSPLHNVTARTPPALVFLGTKDALVPVQTIRAFERRMTEAGVRCQVEVIDGGGHPLYSYREGPSAVRDRLLPECHAFLRSVGVF
jgi:acetyl esterase